MPQNKPKQPDEWEDVEGDWEDVSPTSQVTFEQNPQAYAQQQATASLRKPIEKSYREHLSSLPPQERYVQSLPQDQQEEAGNRIESGMGMGVPETLLTAGLFAPGAAISRLGVKGAINTVGRTMLRGAAGAFVGEEAGSRVGGRVGKYLGSEETGSTIGGLAGGMYLGGKALANPAYMARIPWGIGRMFMGEEEYATAKAAQELSMRNARINAGLIKPKVPSPQVDQLFSPTRTSTNTGGYSTTPLELPPEATDLFSPQQHILPESMKVKTPAEPPIPLRPLIGTPEEWSAYEQKMNILKPEASDAGTYHAARGSTKAKFNLQQRIGKKLEK